MDSFNTFHRAEPSSYANTKEKNMLKENIYASKASDVNGPSSLIFLAYSSSLAT